MRIISLILFTLFLVCNGVMAEEPEKTPVDQIFRTRPYLQNPVGGGITVCWMTNVPVYSWVEYGTDTTQLQQARRIVDGQTVCNNDLHKVRLNGLQAGQTYYYRVCSREILLYQAYSKKFGDTACSPFYSFKLPEKKDEEVTILVFNDIHNQSETLKALYKQVQNVDYNLVIFNGDCMDAPATQGDAVKVISALNDIVDAAQIPVVYLRGNHEIRNAYSMQLHELFDYIGGKTYGAFNWGNIRFVLLDCGEDKPDDFWVYYGLNDFTQFRNDQVDFLKSELRSKDFRKADNRVLIHHIPLYGNESKYQPCLELWGGILGKAPFDISLNAHNHRFAYYKKGQLGNHFPVVIGGGYSLEDATVMVLKKKGARMTFQVINTKGEILKELEFNK